MENGESGGNGVEREGESLMKDSAEKKNDRGKRKLEEMGKDDCF
jgi:hypothetical protein